jgi:hypothetical protein
LNDLLFKIHNEMWGSGLNENVRSPTILHYRKTPNTGG